MKKSKYSYFFDIENEYVGYSYLADSFVAFPLEQKKHVEKILKFSDDILTNTDAGIYKELCRSKCLISNDFDEYNYLLMLHRQLISQKEVLALTIIPTMSCNCRCPYCYELHPNLKNSHLSNEVIANLKKYIKDSTKTIKELNIGWFGGEPLICMEVIQDISEFCIELCKKEDVIFHNSMTTNGVLLNDKNIQTLENCKINTLQITLDGPQERHDQTRVTVSGKPTFEIIRKNISAYLDNFNDNRINLRIHLEADITGDEYDEIIKMLKSFDNKHKQKISPYPHIVFAACTDTWANDSTGNCNIKQKTTEYIEKIVDKITNEISKLNFNIVHNTARRPSTACLYELSNNWVVRSDGYLTKCTVGIEKERAIAKLTKDGIKLYPERFLKNMQKEFSPNLYEHCKNCELLPFCWQRCTYQHYLNPDFDTFISYSCPKGKSSWLITRQINEIKSMYKKKKHLI